ncbi:MAG: PAS domain S-box protein [Anaerolineae bacterium]|nr:PAS domain S-box protein [Anaerolineae bacterium]
METEQQVLSALIQARHELEAAKTKVAALEADFAAAGRPSNYENADPSSDADIPPKQVFFRKLIEFSQDNIALVDARGRTLYTNPKHNVLGYTLEEHAARSFSVIIHPDDVQRTQQFFAALLAAPGATRIIEVRFLHKMGHYVWVEVSATNLLHDPDVGGIVTNSRDITSRKLAEQEVRASEARYRQVVEQQTDLICRYDSDFRLTFVNEAYSRAHGKPANELIGVCFLDYVLPEDRAQIVANIQTLSHAQPDAEYENRMYDAEGKLRWFQWKDSILLDDENNIREYQGVGREITERKNLETEQWHQLQVIEEMRGMLQASLDASPNHMAVVERDGTIITVNTAWKRYGDQNGVTRPVNYLGANYLAVCRQATGKEAAFAAQVADGIEDVIEGRRDSFAVEYPCHSPTQQRWFRMHVTPFDERAPRRVVINHFDVTQHKQTEQIIKTAHDTLEQRVAERTAELASTTQQLEASLEHEREFQHYLMKLHEVVIELTTIDELDEFYQRVVKLGLEQLGFERLALFLYDAEHGHATGTYGTDSQRNVIPEHHLRLASTDSEKIMMQALLNSKRFIFDENAVLQSNLAPIGNGWNAASVLWDGHRGLGWLTADNAISKQPASTMQLDILALYSLSVGTLLARKQAEVRLAEERNLMRTLIDAVPDFLYVKDIKHRTLLNNVSRGRSLGFQTAEEVNGTTDADFYPSELAAKFHAEEDELFCTGTPLLDHEEYSRTVSGELKWVSTNKVPLRNLKGEIIGLAGVSRDISERKARERELRFHAGLQEAVMDAVIATDMEFNIQSWNKAAEKMYGWSAEEVLGVYIRDILKPHFASDYVADHMREIVVENGYWVGEVIHHHRDGRHLHILSSVVLLKDNNGQPIGAVEVNHDITERKHADDVLQQKIEEEREFQHYLKELHDISMELALIDQLDDFYRVAVEQGLQRLGFERLALFLYDQEAGMFDGTFGTGPAGEITDERQLRFIPQPNGVMMRALTRAERICVDEDTALFSDLKTIGTGWNAAAVLWNGTRSIGLLVADNFITHKPCTKQTLDLLALYALTIGTLLGRKQTEVALRQSEASLLSVMNSTSVGIVLVGRDGVIRLANQLAHTYSTWLYQHEIVAGKTSIYELGVVERVKLEATFAQVFAGQRMAHEISKTIGTQLYAFDMHYDPVVTSTGETIGATVSIINISTHKEAEAALRQAFEKEKELGELKSRFVSMASHEFRTPLATILATTETLMHYRSRITDEQIDLRFEKIRQQVWHMKEIMEDILQLSRIQTGHMDFNPTYADLNELCSEIVEEHLSSASTPNRIVYSCAQPPVIAHIDLRLMRQIINNLVTNALKYSPSDSAVRVTLSSHDEQVVISVADDGIGIPPEDRKHLFAPFHRAGNVGAISGTGLGLVIIKQAVELHGGTIHVDSQVGVGTTFTIVIPITTKSSSEDENVMESPEG